jgi:GNAT superfamily N-acetyltransferase
MVTYQVETYDQVVPDIKELIKLHYDEVALHKESIPLDPDWARYKVLEDNGMLFIATARDQSQLVGYSVFFVTRHMHYNSTLMASNDILYLHPDYRQGMSGIKLIKFSESELKKRNITKVLWHIKFQKDFRKILYRMGYVDEDAIVGKILKD